MRRIARSIALPLLMLVALTSSGCGESNHHSSLRPTANATTREISTIPAETAVTKPFLGDGDYDRVGDGDGDNKADHDKDPQLDHLPSDAKEGESNRYHDADDLGLLNYGHAPTHQQELAIVTAVQRYYTTAASENGASACTQLTQSLAQVVPVDYGKYGPSYLSTGKTCASVMTLLFQHYHRQLEAGVTVTSVGISNDGNEAYALLGSTAFPASFIIVQREHDAWKMGQLLATENKQA